MRLDIRVPIGLLFALFGVILTVYGLFGNQAIYHRSLGINVNLIWGLVMLAFGVAMLLLARLQRQTPPAPDTPQDQPPKAP
jgi:hypothetical protein